mmetsp:Transcript_30586/g.42193  ORF Transcript_30586/g.42193 Transcript_30586/m.42193 type:complete len:1186 (+) Transcript_30586:404-3961(+)
MPSLAPPTAAGGQQHNSFANSNHQPQQPAGPQGRHAKPPSIPQGYRGGGRPFSHLPRHQTHRPPAWPDQVLQVWKDTPSLTLPSSSKKPASYQLSPSKAVPKNPAATSLSAAFRASPSPFPETDPNGGGTSGIFSFLAAKNFETPGGWDQFQDYFKGALSLPVPSNASTSPDDGEIVKSDDTSSPKSDELEDELVSEILSVADHKYLLSILSEDGEDAPPSFPYSWLQTDPPGKTHRRIQSEEIRQSNFPSNFTPPSPSSLMPSPSAEPSPYMFTDSRNVIGNPVDSHNPFAYSEKNPSPSKGDLGGSPFSSFVPPMPTGSHPFDYHPQNFGHPNEQGPPGFDSNLLFVDGAKQHRRSYSSGQAHPHATPEYARPYLGQPVHSKLPVTSPGRSPAKEMKIVVGGDKEDIDDDEKKGGQALSNEKESFLLPPAPSLPTDKISLQEYLSCRRAETQEPPATKRQYKAFCKELKLKEKEGYAVATEWAKNELQHLPSSAHYKVYMEVADLGKRQNRIKHARHYYVQVHRMQPFASQGWLEHAKMEEECGDMERCGRVLNRGLFFCPYNENLLVKGIKHQERIGNIPAARALLSRLKRVPVERTWKATLEGALMEARNGNGEVARKVFKYLMQHVPWHGPVYLEASRFEEREEDYEKSIQIIEKGLVDNPRYAPLWFAALKAYEKCETIGGLEKVRETVQRAVKVITKELIWKVWFEAAQVEERSCWRICEKRRRKLEQVRTERMKNVHDLDLEGEDDDGDWESEDEAKEAGSDLLKGEEKSKVTKKEGEEGEEDGGGLGVGGRPRKESEKKVFYDSLKLTRQAYAESVRHCPSNLLWKVWLAGARTEINFGHIQIGRRLLRRALKEVPQKMRAFVLMEVARLEEYAGRISLARQILTKAREESVHEWKVFLESILLEVRCGELRAALKQATEALRAHSATGRLWAAMIQVSHIEGEAVQEKVFRMALNEVPKSGEVWCEGARICLRRKQWSDAKEYLNFAVRFTPQYGDSFIEFLRFELLQARRKILSENPSVEMTPELLVENADVRSLEQLCLNVDPNYGAMWLSCKVHPLDSTRDIFRRATRRLAKDIHRLHLSSLQRFKEERREEAKKDEKGKKKSAKKEGEQEEKKETQNDKEVKAHEQELFHRLIDDVLDEAECCSPLSLNGVYVRLAGEDRRRAIFGSDSIK